MSELTAKASVLVVDDEEDILELLRVNLGREGFRVVCADSGETALQIIKTDPPALVLLDLMLPGADGLDVCRRLKSDPSTRNLPIIMLTARSEEADVVVGLELGADDYVTKPFSPRVLTARIKSVLRRKESETAQKGPSLAHGDLVIHLERFEAQLDGSPLDLTSTEFRILALLAGRPGRVFSRDQIVDAARGENYPVTDRSVDVHIVSLRKKLGDHGSLIDTVRGVGYRFHDDSSPR